MKNILIFSMMYISVLYIQAQNESKLVIDAGVGQTNNNPLIRLRNSLGNDILWIHSNNSTNAFLGVNAGQSNSSGVANTFLGAAACNANQTAGNNTAVGHVSMWDNRTGGSNTSVGSYAFTYSKTGDQNTALGSETLLNTDGASLNTAVGYAAGRTYNNGWNNVFIGAGTDVTLPGLYNVVAVGQGTGVAAHSTARFGNAETTSIGGQVNWTSISDGRYKKNIKDNVPGLEFVLKLEPVTYNLDASGISKALRENQGKEWDDQMKKGIAQKEQMQQTGFIAQDVERIAKEIGFDFSGVDAPKNDQDLYGLRYAEFVVPLVKAVQELNAALLEEVETLTAKNQELVDRMSKMEEILGVREAITVELNNLK